LDEINSWGEPYFQSSTRSSADKVEIQTSRRPATNSIGKRISHRSAIGGKLH
jgi:hypothetical protein